MWGDNYFTCNYLSISDIHLRQFHIAHISFFTVFADTKHFQQHTYNAEDEQSPNYSTPHSTNVKFEDAFFQCFVENGSTYKYGEEIFLDRFLYTRAQGKLYKTHERFYEHVRKTKPIRSVFDVKKQYLTGSNQVNYKTYICFHKGDHVRKSSSLAKEKFIFLCLNYL